MSEDKVPELTQEQKAAKRAALLAAVRSAGEQKQRADTVAAAAEAMAKRAAVAEAEAFYNLCLYLAETLEKNPKWPKNTGASGYFMLDGSTYFFQAGGWKTERGVSRRDIRASRMSDPCFDLAAGRVQWDVGEMQKRADEVPF